MIQKDLKVLMDIAGLQRVEWWLEMFQISRIIAFILLTITILVCSESPSLLPRSFTFISSELYAPASVRNLENSGLNKSVVLFFLHNEKSRGRQPTVPSWEQSLCPSPPR